MGGRPGTGQGRSRTGGGRPRTGQGVPGRGPPSVMKPQRPRFRTKLAAAPQPPRASCVALWLLWHVESGLEANNNKVERLEARVASVGPLETALSTCCGASPPAEKTSGAGAPSTTAMRSATEMKPSSPTPGRSNAVKSATLPGLPLAAERLRLFSGDCRAAQSLQSRLKRWLAGRLCRLRGEYLDHAATPVAAIHTMSSA